MQSFSYHAIGTFSADCSSHLTNQDRSAFHPCKRDADQNRGAMPDLHTASWACVMERNQPSRSSRQARSIASLFGSFGPPIPPTFHACLLIHIAPTDMSNVSVYPSSRTATQHSLRGVPNNRPCATKALRLFRPGVAWTAAFWSVCLTTVSCRSNSVYLVPLIFACGFPAHMLALICHPKKHGLFPQPMTRPESLTSGTVRIGVPHQSLSRYR